MSDIDLSLPATVPGMQRYRDRPMTLDSFAVYNLIGARDPQSDLVETCNLLCPRDDYVHFRKTSDVNSFESLINLHLETTAQAKLDPGLFLVVADQDWKENGLYVVTLEDDEGKPGKFLVKAEDSGILLVNLQIGNTDWTEAKESYEINDDDGTQGPPPGMYPEQYHGICKTSDLRFEKKHSQTEPENRNQLQASTSASTQFPALTQMSLSRPLSHVTR